MVCAIGRPNEALDHPLLSPSDSTYASQPLPSLGYHMQNNPDVSLKDIPITGVTRATTTVMVDTGQAGNKTSSALPPSVVPPGRTPLSSSDTSLKLVLPPRSVRLNAGSGVKIRKTGLAHAKALDSNSLPDFLVSRSHVRTL